MQFRKLEEFEVGLCQKPAFHLAAGVMWLASFKNSVLEICL